MAVSSIELSGERARICNALRAFSQDSSRPRALVGFDGYVDKLVRPRRSQEGREYFNTISEFSDFLKYMGATSSDVAVHSVFEKIGGNGPLLGQALAAKGVPAACIGAMGEGGLIAEYKQLAESMELYSVCRCAGCYAFEFDDGKLMFGDAECFDELTWGRVKERVGEDTLLRLFSDAKLLGFANWSGLPHATGLLEGILSDICPALDYMEGRCMFFDLADPSGKSDAQFSALFSSLERLSGHYHTVVGLNPKECLHIYNHYFGKRVCEFAPELVQALLEDFPAGELAVHVAGGAYAGLRGQTLTEVRGRFLEKPRISVGAGDNFNSGYCMGKLLGLTPCDCAALGNEAAVIFMERESPATLDDLIAAFDADGGTNIK